jgi:hypothetical protein
MCGKKIMSTQTTPLATFIKMSAILEKSSNAVYSVFDFLVDESINTINTLNTTGQLYVRNRHTGDYVTAPVIENGEFTTNRKIIWAERKAKRGDKQPAFTKFLNPILRPGDCFTTLKLVDKKWITDSIVFVPPGMVGLVHLTEGKMGYISVVTSKVGTTNEQTKLEWEPA